MKRTTMEDIDYLCVLLKIMYEDGYLSYMGITLTEDGDIIADCINSFISGEIKNIEDIKDKEKVELLKDYKIDRNMLIDLRKLYDRLVFTYKELEELNKISSWDNYPEKENF